MESLLEEEIEYMREAMMHAAMKEGRSALATMELSGELDALMNQFAANEEKTSR